VLFNDGKLVVVDLSNKSLENNTITSDEAWLMTAGEVVETTTVSVTPPRVQGSH
jgi:hypothetical protein